MAVSRYRLLAAVIAASAAVGTIDYGTVGAATSGPSHRTIVTIVSFSDYHSHAVPFRFEGRPRQAGIARTVAYLREAKREGATLVVSGGDILSADVPAWSDECRCVEWPWLSGLLDVMALGNHDLDYGFAAFETCRRSASFPVLLGNLTGADGRPLLVFDEKPWLVRSFGGQRIGLFAVGGGDLPALIRPERLPTSARWNDAQETARDTVRRLRAEEHVDAILAIGHQHRDQDWAKARAVSGIDLILGSHSHDLSELQRIPGTDTWYISAHQYLTHLARVRLEFEGGRIARVEGGLVRMDDAQPEDPVITERVRDLQQQIEARRPDRFQVIGTTTRELSDTGGAEGESAIGSFVTDLGQRAVSAHCFVSTASSFRGGLPAGPLTTEDVMTALPYRNNVLVATVRGDAVVDLMILIDPARPQTGFAPLRDDGVNRLATTDYIASAASPFAAGLQDLRWESTGIEVRELVIGAIRP